MPNKNSKKGFTLIELLVTIAIIAILAAIGMVVYSSTQKTARISKRLQDLQALQTAVETYKAGNGFYPKAIGAGTPLAGLCIGVTTAGALSNSSVSPAFIPTYMQTLPIDPSSADAATAPCYRYMSDANGTEYKIWIIAPEMTNTEFRAQPSYIDPDRDGGTADNCAVDSTTVTAWAVYVSNGTAATNACAF